jgi:hypothetical protein
MLPVREVPLTEAEFHEFGLYAGQGMKLLGFADEADAPETVVRAIGRFIDEWDPEHATGERELAIIAMCIGLVWGHQVTRELGWQWAVLEQDGQRSYAVVSPDRAYATHPTVLMAQWLQGARDNTVILLFNMVRAGNLPPSAPHTYLGLS